MHIVAMIVPDVTDVFVVAVAAAIIIVVVAV